MAYLDSKIILEKNFEMASKFIDSLESHERIQKGFNIGTSINLNPDPLVSSMAEYATQGGGNTRFKLKGFRGYKSLSDNKIKFEIDDLEIDAENNGSFSYLINTLRNLLKAL